MLFFFFLRFFFFLYNLSAKDWGCSTWSFLPSRLCELPSRGAVQLVPQSAVSAARWSQAPGVRPFGRILGAVVFVCLLLCFLPPYCPPFLPPFVPSLLPPSILPPFFLLACLLFCASLSFPTKNLGSQQHRDDIIRTSDSSPHLSRSNPLIKVSDLHVAKSDGQSPGPHQLDPTAAFDPKQPLSP